MNYPYLHGNDFLDSYNVFKFFSPSLIIPDVSAAFCADLCKAVQMSVLKPFDSDIWKQVQKKGTMRSKGIEITFPWVTQGMQEKLVEQRFRLTRFDTREA